MKTLQPDLKIQTVWDNVWGIVQVRMHARVSLSMCLCLCLPTTHTDPNPSPRPLLRQVVFLPGGKVLTVHKPGELHIYDSILAKSQVGIQTCVGVGVGVGVGVYDSILAKSQVGGPWGIHTCVGVGVGVGVGA